MQPGIPKEPQENKHKQVYNYRAHLCGATARTAPSLLPCLLVAGEDWLEEEGVALWGQALGVRVRVTLLVGVRAASLGTSVEAAV